MKIEPLDLTVRDLVAGYHDQGDGGVEDIVRMLGIQYVRGNRKYAPTVLSFKS